MKETFIIRTEWSDAILELEPIDQATIFRNLFNFHLGNNNLINLNNLSVKLVWKLIEPNLHRNIADYDRRRDTSGENGAKGGRPKGSTKNTTFQNNLNNLTQEPNLTKEPNETLSVIVTDSVSDTVTVTVSDSDLLGKPARTKFLKPEYSDVLSFMKEKIMIAGGIWPEEKIFTEAKKFWNYYESNGWRVGKNPMKDWNAAARNWMNNAHEFKNGNSTAKNRQQRDSAGVVADALAIIDAKYPTAPNTDSGHS